MSTRSVVRGCGVVVLLDDVEQKEKDERNIVPVKKVTNCYFVTTDHDEIED